MSCPFNLSPWFTIVLTRISSVFQGQPSWIPSRGHPISFAYAHIYEIQDIHHLHKYIYISFVLHTCYFATHRIIHKGNTEETGGTPAVLPPTTNLTKISLEWSWGSRLTCHCLSASKVSQTLVADSNCKYLHQTAFQLPVLKWRHLTERLAYDPITIGNIKFLVWTLTVLHSSYMPYKTSL